MIVDIQMFKSMKPAPSNAEKRWFEEHPQFYHLFHMKLDANANGNTKKKGSNHNVQGMWMMLLRTVDVAKRREGWFIVNGVLIRYELREHTLISGLNCRNYPLEYKEFGDRKFVLEDVKAKLLAMGSNRERLKMMVLFFLGNVVYAQKKVGVGANDVLDFFQRDVDDLEFCKTFSWGRYSFDYMVKEISHAMDHFGGFVKEKTTSYFGAIPKLRMGFRESVEGADVDCPRMCQSTFKN
ncbi:hypothetical protein N665_0410s0012 [Sinapis alba]|nr:hypothetical protein N665_0410s0012 [Sinapis alba]